MTDESPLQPIGSWITPGDLKDPSHAMQALAKWTFAARGAYADNTQRAWRADWRSFYSYCESTKQVALPAEPVTVKDFILHCVAQGKKAATLRRYVATITRAHSAARSADPCRGPPTVEGKTPAGQAL